MGNTSHFKDMFAFFNDLKGELALLKRAANLEDRDLMVAQLQAAARSHVAIASVTGTVTTIKDQMDSAARMVGTVAQKMALVQQGAGNIATAISQQQAATREITGHAEHAAQDAEHVREFSKEVNVAAVQVGEVADEMQQLMAGLESRATALREASNSFLDRLRAA